jgi:glycosyltransferase involved in cell wall biosynthesis
VSLKLNLLFTIVVPSYNRANFIAKTINSVLNQTYANFELIIVDDGSTDTTESIVKSFTDYRISYYKTINSERGAARNYGIKKAKGDYITFLDSDDILYPNYLKNARESLVNKDYPNFFHLAYEVSNTNGKIISKIDWLKPNDISFIFKGNPLSCMGVFMKKEITEKFHFNEDRLLSGSEDWELWLRVIANYNLQTDNRISACLIQHDDRSVMSFDENKLYKRKELALKYAFEDPVVNKRFKEHFKKIDAYADGYIALHLLLAGKNWSSLKYVLKSIFGYPLSIFSRRFLVFNKYFILNLFR